MGKTNCFLIDTHIFLWFLGNDSRLTKNVLNLLEDPTHTVYLSTASIWEIVLKVSVGKLQIPNNLNIAIEASGFTLLPVELSHVLNLRQLPMHHKDPFDRLLVAQALSE